MLAAFKVLLYRYSGRRDLVVTSTAAARTKPEFERVIGQFYNHLYFRSTIDPQASFSKYVEQLDTIVMEGLANQDYPAPAVIATVDPEYLTDRNAIDQVGFHMLRPDNLDDRGFAEMLLDMDGSSLQFGSIEIRSLPLADESCTRDFYFYYIQHDGQIHMKLRYNADMFEPKTASRIADDYAATLGAVLADPDAIVDDLVASLSPEAVVSGE